MHTNNTFKMVAKTAQGLEDVLVTELTQLGAAGVVKGLRMVEFTGNMELLYKANYALRTAISILKPIAAFEATNENDLYKGVYKIDWSQYLDVDQTFSVHSTVHSPHFQHSHFAALKVKDAIADQFRVMKGSRPNVDVENPSVKIDLHIQMGRVNLSLDSSGDPLFKRGYRTATGLAPINEVLAAGMILLSGWDGKSSFIDPMCGSGTIAIEAAMIAANIAPGKFRPKYGFQTWKNYDEALFKQSCASFPVNKMEMPSILASDSDKHVLDAARKNIENAGLEHFVRVRHCRFEDLERPGENGTLIFNPPYGERLQDEDLTTFYGMVGSTLKHHFYGYEAWLITSSPSGMKSIGLKPAKKHILFNGALECRYLKFELYGGSKKQKDCS